jgi:hypothetical protein
VTHDEQSLTLYSTEVAWAPTTVPRPTARRAVTPNQNAILAGEANGVRLRSVLSMFAALSTDSAVSPLQFSELSRSYVTNIAAGTTSDFCGTETVVAPSCSGSSSNGRTVG